LSALIVAVALGVGLGHPAFGQNMTKGTADSLQKTPSNSGGIAGIFGDIGYYVIGKIAYGIGYIWAWIGGIIIGIEAWLVGVMLDINTGVFSSQLVQVGFGISLSIANLGFILGIIIIAIATILRRESYGIKQLLWKLIVAAILVNFSLVIMAPVFGFTNSLSQYFLNCIDPSVGCSNPQGFTVVHSMNYFADALVGQFNPQNGLTAADALQNSDAAGSNPNFKNVQGALGSEAGKSFGAMLIPIFSLASVAAALTIFVITLGAFLIMLLVRYVYIAILAILMPFAWLMWVFPKLSHHWSKWWNNFIRWSFFAPIVLFFLYLAIITARSMSNGTAIESQSFATYTSSSWGGWAAVSNFFSNIFSPIISTLLSQFIYAGLCVGGIFAANSMGIAGADVAMKAVGGAKDWAVGKAGTITKKAGRAAFRGMRGEKLVSAMQQGKLTETLKGIPKVGGAIHGAAQLVTLGQLGKIESATGRGLADVATNNRGMVDAESKNVSRSKDEFIKNIAGQMSDQRRMAELKNANEKGWIKAGMTVDGVMLEKFLDRDRKKFHSYGQDGEGSLEEALRFKTRKLFDDVDEENKKLEARNVEIDKNRKEVPEEEIKKQGKISDEDMQFYKTATREEVSKNFMEADRRRWYTIEEKVLKAKKGLGLDDPKQQNEYDDNVQKIEGNNGKLARLMLKDPETTAQAFMDDEAARAKFIREGKEPPATLDKNKLERDRAFIIQTMAGKYSASNGRAMFDALGKANILPYFESAVEEMKKGRKDQFVVVEKLLDQNRDLKRWMQNNAGKAMFGSLKELFNLRSVKKGKEVDDDDEEEEERNNNTP